MGHGGQCCDNEVEKNGGQNMRYERRDVDGSYGLQNTLNGVPHGGCSVRHSLMLTAASPCIYHGGHGSESLLGSLANLARIVTASRFSVLVFHDSGRQTRDGHPH